MFVNCTLLKYRMSNFTQQLMGRRHKKVDNTYKEHNLHDHGSTVVICKSGTCAQVNTSHSNPTTNKFNYSTENTIGVLPCGVLNWLLRLGSHAVHCHVQYVYKHVVRRLQYGLPDDFSHAI